MNLEDLEIGEQDWSDSSYRSRIYYCTNKITKEEFALKKSRQPFPEERIELMKKVFQLSHPNLLLPVDWEITAFGFVNELYKKIEWPTLDRLLYELKEDEKVNLADMLRIMLQLTEVLSLFHKEGIIHHDVRDRNIFVDRESLDIRVYDYNCITKPYFLRTGRDSRNPVPPEYMKGNCAIDFQFDVYQAGHIFRNTTHSCDFQSKKMEPLFDLPEKAREIINRALSEDRKERYRDCSELQSELKSLL
ncbi:hypothetical protein A3K73_08230 [Candidatus Pacearchaeota archaeon RBG_13_36_9]|nr:MAG: hypothetical protein A3K73_08230 [Candidatus Pacearchaeota archaeon RBG_13_36_9]